MLDRRELLQSGAALVSAAGLGARSTSAAGIYRGNADKRHSGIVATAPSRSGRQRPSTARNRNSARKADPKHLAYGRLMPCTCARKARRTRAAS